MKRNVYIFSVAIALTSVLMFSSSCKKDDDDPTNTDKITGKNYVMNAWAIDPPISYQGITITDLFTFLHKHHYLHCELVVKHFEF